jgi:hypothetical protein
VLVISRPRPPKSRGLVIGRDTYRELHVLARRGEELLLLVHEDLEGVEDTGPAVGVVSSESILTPTSLFVIDLLFHIDSRQIR